MKHNAWRTAISHVRRRHAVVLAWLALFLCGADQGETSPTYSVTEADLVYTMNQRDANGNLKYGDIRFADWCNTYQEFYPVKGGASDFCHTQGVTAIGSKVVTSCQADTNNARMQVYNRSAVANTTPSAVFSVHSGALDHPVVGTGVDHYEYDDSGFMTEHTQYYPIVTANVDDKTQSAVVDIYDIANNNSPVCSFSHTGRPTDRALGAVSMVVSNNVTYLAACGWDCNDLYIYQLDLSAARCGNSLIGTFDGKNNAAIRVDAGAGDKNWGTYNGIALFASGGNVFMIGTHNQFMATWRIQGFGGPASGVVFRKLARFRWDATWDDQTYFKQSLGLERVSSTRLAIWLSPHDYKDRRECGGNCSRLYRCERKLTP
jgi:hypothetical protein